MNEQIKELAKQAGFHIASSNLGDIGWVWCSDGYPIDEQLDALVKLVRQDEREACAVVCESEGHRIDASWESCATAIRARWQK
jgi:hypothetical protein